MKNVFYIFSLVLVSLSGCSSSTESRATTTVLSDSLSTINTKLNSTAAVVATSRFAETSEDYYQENGIYSAGINVAWTQAAGVSGLYNGTYTTLKQWFINEFNPSFLNSTSSKVTFAGRVTNSLGNLCYVSRLITTVDSTGLPPAGSYPVVVTAAVDTACNGDGGAVNQSVTVTVTDTTDKTTYDKNFSVGFGNACPYKFKARVTSTAINIVSAEDQNCDGRNYGSYAVVQYNKSTNVLRFMYQSQGFGLTVGSPGGFEFYRGYYDGGTDEAYVLGTYGADNGTAGSTGLTSHVAYTAAGKPSAGGNTAISAKVFGFSGGAGLTDDVYNGCVNTATTNVTSGATDTLACSVTGTSATTGFATIVARRAAMTSRADLYGITETTAVGFTNNTDMF